MNVKEIGMSNVVVKGIPTQVAFQIGNSEITNLLVQNEVAKVQVQINALNDEIDASWKETERIKIVIQSYVLEQAPALFNKSIRELMSAWFTLYQPSKPDDYDDYKITWDFEAVWLIYRNGSNQKWDKGFPTKVNVGFSMIKTSDNDEHYLYIPNPDRSKAVMSVPLSDELVQLGANARRLNNERRDLGAKRDALKVQISDTSSIEKRVLAALTQQSLSANPDIMNQVQGIVAMIDAGPLLIEGTKG
jgi:hypothetical protein